MADDSRQQDRIEVFRNMLEADPENELANFTLGKLYLESGDLAGAEKTLRKTIELNPVHSMSYRLLGQTLVEAGRRDEAIEVLREGVQVAHRKGDFQPRNAMQEMLGELGVEPPELESSAPESASEGEAGGWTCSRCGRPNPQMERAPLPGALGELIHERICQPCWGEWIGMSVKVINEYRLNLASEEGNRIWEAHLREFLGLPPEDETS